MFVEICVSFLSHFCLVPSCNFPLCHTLPVWWQASVLKASTNTWYMQIWENPSNSSYKPWPKPRLSERNHRGTHTRGTLPSSHSHIKLFSTRGEIKQFLSYIFCLMMIYPQNITYWENISFHNSLAFLFVKINILVMAWGTDIYGRIAARNI